MNTSRPLRASPRTMPRLARVRARAAGLSLIELLIALVLGLLIVGGALTVFLSNRQTFRAAEGLSRVQESARVAFELMARDLRDAAMNACEFRSPVSNVLANQGTAWWSPATGTGFPAFFVGFDGGQAFPDAAFGTSEGDRINGTDAVQYISAPRLVQTVESHDPVNGRITVQSVNHGFRTGDVAVICDFETSALFQVSSATSGSSDVIGHAASAGTPGNSRIRLVTPIQDYRFGCFKGLFDVSGCREPDPADPTPREWPALIARVEAVRWYVGVGAGGGRSLYRAELTNTAGVLSVDAVEVADNIGAFELSYLEDPDDGYEAASAIANWADVRAVRVQAELLSPEAVTNEGQQLSRQFVHTIALRSRT